jgi:DNA-directed RNA polymerase beta subunit
MNIPSKMDMNSAMLNLHGSGGSSGSGSSGTSKELAKSSGLQDKKTNNLTIDDVFKFVELYFDRNGVLFSHLYNSFNKFIEEDIVSFLKTGDHTFFEKLTKDKSIKYKFKYDKICIEPPTMEGGVEPMFPADARNKNTTYFGKLLANVTQIQEVTDIATGEVTEKVIGIPEDNIPIANIPIMMRSKYCSLTIHPGYDKRDCEYDAGGYFVINGSEKVIIAQDRMCENKAMTFIKKDSGTEIYTVQITSKSYRIHGLTQILNVRMKKNGEITIKVPILSEINVFSLFRAMGIETDKDIINIITYNENDYDMINLIKQSLDKCVDEDGEKIKTSQKAVDYLIGKLRVLKKYSDTDKNIRNQQKKLHLNDLLKNNFLPHIESNDVRMKAYYLGYMINKLLNCYLGRTKPDDRDSYLNKRIDLPGDLMMELFKQFYRMMLNYCNKFFKKRNSSDDDPLNIIHQIKPNIIEQGMRAALSTGAWPRRKGVAQVLQRLTYMYTITLLRRVDAPGGDASTSKLTGPRILHPSSASLLCCLTGDSEVLTGNAMEVEYIKNIKDGENVMTVYKDTLKEQPSEIHKYFSRESDNIIEINTISGRKLKCTLDHPLLTRRNNKLEMVNAGELKIGDEVVIRHMQKYTDNTNGKELIIPIDSQLKQNHIEELLKLNLVGKSIDNSKLPVLARLLGANITGNKYYNKEDAERILLDINNLGFRHSNIVYNSDRCKIELESTFKYFMKIIGDNSDKNTKRVPIWIKNGSSKVKQEYLSSLFGNDEIINLEINNLYQNTNSQFVGEVSELLKEFGINNSNDPDNVIKIMDYIGFRYSEEKSRKSGPIVEYFKYQKEMNSKDTLNYQDFIKKYKLENHMLAIPIKEIKELQPEKVYDFETKLDSHTFIVNGFVTSNCVQTPEHAKVGLTKHLNLISSITIFKATQMHIIKSFLKKELIDIRDVQMNQIRNYTKVFFNGDWLGLTNEPSKLENELRKNKLNGTFEPTTSIVYDIFTREIRVYCDTGRMYRPVIRVENNIIKLTKEHINNISLNKSDKDKITSWNEFLNKYNDVIEYIDMEEQPYLMLADTIKKVEEMRTIMTDSIKKVKDFNGIITNRYDDMVYVKYTHCEFHPSLLIGEIVTNIPFINANQGPRNIYYYSQGRQAMGIYASNYRDRLDISYILYNPQRPVVSTRASKFINSDILPSGENCVVAIACYTGYNQEDSLVFNKSAVDRGLFSSKSLKKYMIQVQKNQSTGQDDQLAKPDPTKVTGLRHGSYDKLNDKGYAPEETPIVNGDIILGKISPIQPVGTSTKTFKDSSETYKSHASGVVDKVYTNIYTNEGYEMRKMRVRSERIPMIGDKFCSRHGQKGTCGILMKASNMPFTKNGVQPDIIVNTHAIK